MASETDPLVPLKAALRDLVAWLGASDVAGVVIGGVAAALLGRPRVTRDVDAVVLLDEGRWEEFLATGSRFGFVPRIPDAVQFARQSRTLLVRHHSSSIDTDIAFGALPFEEEVITRSISVDLGDFAVPLPTAADLIVMKMLAHRPRDLADVEGILDTHPRLNLQRTRRWLKDLAAIVEMPELVEELESLVIQSRQRKKGKRQR
jgi:hypothetical protein